MSSNSFGNFLRFTSFGESHGKMIGGVLDGFPPGVLIDFDFIKAEMMRRRPGYSGISSNRKEADEVEIISGVHNGISTGAPIAFLINNENARPDEYSNIRDSFRPSHADFTYYKKYGISGLSGGGRSSARETACRLAAGALAKCFLRTYNINISAYTSGIGSIDLEKAYNELNLDISKGNPVSCPDPEKAVIMENLILEYKNKGDSIGGRISCVIKGVLSGLGDPVFDKLQANLAKAMLSIPAAKAFEYGSGLSGSYMTGSQHNDEFFIDKNNSVHTRTNFSGGIQGGISNGEDIYFKVAFKPVSSISKKQNTVNVKGESEQIEINGRHDSCVVPRAVPVVEAMAALVIADALIINRTQNDIGINK
ncbi:MAG: chorismate synthase [Bacteroidales bacterium]